MSALFSAVSFLTRVPAGRRARTECDLVRAVPWFPVVGALVGLAVAGVYAAGAAILPHVVAAPIAVGIGALVTGGFHEDGLGDTADALGSRAERTEALRILRDPRLGTFGVLAVTLTVIIRVAAVASTSPGVVLAVIPAAHILSRGAAVAVLAMVPAASEEGLGATVRAGPRATLAGVTAAVAMAAVAVGWGVLPLIPAAAIPAAALALLARRRLGGVTGDVLGAVQQGGETAILVVGATGLLVPWWS